MPVDPKTGRRIHGLRKALPGRGVTYHKRDKVWQAKLGNKFLGYYDKKEDAIRARQKAEADSKGIQQQ